MILSKIIINNLITIIQVLYTIIYIIGRWHFSKVYICFKIFVGHFPLFTLVGSLMPVLSNGVSWQTSEWISIWSWLISFGMKIINYDLIVLQLRWWALRLLRPWHCLPQIQLIKSVLRDMLLSITANVSRLCKLLLWLLDLNKLDNATSVCWHDQIYFCSNHKLQEIR